MIAALTAVAISACGSSAPAVPNIAAFTQTPGSAAPCTAIMKALPATLDGQRRVTSTGSRFGAAWGRPAIIVRCGVPEPRSFVPLQGSPCQTVNGIDWYLTSDVPADASSDQPIVMVTVYRKPAIEVSVPASYGTQGPGTAMALLTDVIRAHTAVSAHCV